MKLIKVYFQLFYFSIVSQLIIKSLGSCKMDVGVHFLILASFVPKFIPLGSVCSIAVWYYSFNFSLSRFLGHHIGEIMSILSNYLGEELYKSVAWYLVQRCNLHIDPCSHCLVILHTFGHFLPLRQLLKSLKTRFKSYHRSNQLESRHLSYTLF